MTPIDLIRLRAPLDLRGATLAAYNVERVRGYLEKNLGAGRREVARALNLDPRTVKKAVQRIRNRD